MCYSLWYNVPTMLPAAGLEAEFIGIINKPLLLHLVCVYIITKYEVCPMECDAVEIGKYVPTLRGRCTWHVPSNPPTLPSNAALFI